MRWCAIVLRQGAVACGQGAASRARSLLHHPTQGVRTLPLSSHCHGTVIALSSHSHGVRDRSTNPCAHAATARSSRTGSPSGSTTRRSGTASTCAARQAARACTARAALRCTLTGCARPYGRGLRGARTGCSRPCAAAGARFASLCAARSHTACSHTACSALSCTAPTASHTAHSQHTPPLPVCLLRAVVAARAACAGGRAPRGHRGGV
jgi:hypothetical protein